LLCFVLLIFLSGEAQAEFFGFDAITWNGTATNDFAQQLCVEVTDLSGSGSDNDVRFTFYNYDVGLPVYGIITKVYFDDGMLTNAEINYAKSLGVVAFNTPATPDTLSGGGAYGFDATSLYSADADPSPISNGIAVGEYLAIEFEFVDITYSELIQAIYEGFENGFADNTLQIGLHAQNLPGYDTKLGYWTETGASDSFIMTPVPGAAILGLLGLGVAGIKLRKHS